MSSQSAPLDEAFANAVIDRWAVLFNAHNPALFTELTTEDVVLELAMAPVPVHGRAEAIDFYTNNVWKAFPDCAVQLSDGPFFDPHGPRLALEWRGTGTLMGRLDPPGLDPTGKSFDLRLWEMFEFHGRLASRVVQVFDSAALMRQVGVLTAVPAWVDEIEKSRFADWLPTETQHGALS
jgi:hypothetical protein